MILAQGISDRTKVGSVKNKATFSDQLNQLVEYLNIKQFNLIGFSIGALIAQHFASNFCEKINKLIISNDYCQFYKNIL